MTISLGHSAIPRNTRVYAVGDVHGHITPLESIYQKIRSDLDSTPVEHYTIVFLGDYIDRGPDSAGCVQFLIDLLAQDDHVICLKGNHEAKFEQFLLHPLKLAPSFFTYGGVQCVQSYGVDISAAPAPDNAIITVRDQLFEFIPPSHTSFYLNP